MTQVSPMNSGDDTNSYVKNSTLQRDGSNLVKNALKEALTETLDLTTLLSASSTFTIADLGCSVGPNTLFAVETIVDTVQHMSHSRTLEFQVLFNDLTSNDFNTLFASLRGGPHKYFAAGVPGSFFGRLFPSSSVHVAHTSYSLHWLSKLPLDMRDPKSPRWNPGRIHYTGGAPEAVVRAYASQYEEDMGVFLRARSEEIAPGGVMVILTPGVPDGELLRPHACGIAIDFFGSILMDMVKEGLVKQDEVDAFNFPHVYPSVELMRNLVQKNGCFEIVKMELISGRAAYEVPVDFASGVMHMRAITEGTLVNHFGSEVVDQVFERAFEQKARSARILFNSSGPEFSSNLFAILKRAHGGLHVEP